MSRLQNQKFEKGAAMEKKQIEKIQDNGNPNDVLKLDAGGKPSTWFPPGRLVEHIHII